MFTGLASVGCRVRVALRAKDVDGGGGGDDNEVVIHHVLFASFLSLFERCMIRSLLCSIHHVFLYD